MPLALGPAFFGGLGELPVEEAIAQATADGLRRLRALVVFADDAAADRLSADHAGRDRFVVEGPAAGELDEALVRLEDVEAPEVATLDGGDRRADQHRQGLLAGSAR